MGGRTPDSSGEPLGSKEVVSAAEGSDGSAREVDHTTYLASFFLSRLRVPYHLGEDPTAVCSALEPQRHGHT